MIIWTPCHGVNRNKLVSQINNYKGQVLLEKTCPCVTSSLLQWGWVNTTEVNPYSVPYTCGFVLNFCCYLYYDHRNFYCSKITATLEHYFSDFIFNLFFKQKNLVLFCYSWSDGHFKTAIAMIILGQSFKKNNNKTVGMYRNTYFLLALPWFITDKPQPFSSKV